MKNKINQDYDYLVEILWDLVRERKLSQDEFLKFIDSLGNPLECSCCKKQLSDVNWREEYDEFQCESCFGFLQKQI